MECGTTLELPMQVSWRHVGPNETDHELLWLTVSIGSLGAAALWFTLGFPWPRCVFHQLTGLPCVTCGMTRCGIQFFHGHFLAASKWNPLVFTALCGLTAFDLYAFATLATDVVGPARCTDRTPKHAVPTAPTAQRLFSSCTSCASWLNFWAHENSCHWRRWFHRLASG